MIALCAGRPSEWSIGGMIHPAASICDWYVAPGHGGRLIGRRLVRHFDAPGRIMLAFSMSADAIGYLGRLGWTGPHRSSLMVLPLPALAKLLHGAAGRKSGLDLSDHAVSTGSLSSELASAFDAIEAAHSPSSASRMVRGAKEWAWRLSVCGALSYRICIAHRQSKPAGYVVVRRMTPGRSKALGRITGAIVTDLVAVDDDPIVLRALGSRAAGLAAELGASVAVAAITTEIQRRALSALGFLSPDTPLAGRVLASRSPEFMWLPRGPAAALNPEHVLLNYADSDVDLNL